jgi:hypothetical protein
VERVAAGGECGLMNAIAQIMSRRLARATAAVVLFALVGAVATPGAGPASAKTSRGQCYYFQFDNVLFHNYDYVGESAYCNAVDWATSVVFYNQADIDYVKSILGDLGYEDNSTNSMHMPTKDVSTGVVWDSDAGKKEIACPAVGLEARHYRIYAPPATDYMYTLNWGYFVVGSTHWDANECPSIGTRHYDSEEVEQHIVQTMDGAGYWVYPELYDFQNWEPYRVEGNSEWNNSGYASFIGIY